MSTATTRAAAIMALAALLPRPSAAQLNGSHTLGDYGVQSGSQPQPGFYAALFYLRYDADTIKAADGSTCRRTHHPLQGLRNLDT